LSAKNLPGKVSEQKQKVFQTASEQKFPFTLIPKLLIKSPIYIFDSISPSKTIHTLYPTIDDPKNSFRFFPLHMDIKTIESLS
jgi:hypothetical protein